MPPETSSPPVDPLPGSVDPSRAQSRPTKQRSPTKVEIAKREGRYLRGTIAQTLADPTSSGFGPNDVQLLKFHGIYQQEDRDARSVRRRTGAPKEHRFMVRARIPGGALTASQFLAFDRLAECTGPPPSLRVTTRQTLQLHGLVRGDLGPVVRGLHEALVTTLAACGDVGRNVMAPPWPSTDPVLREVRDLARRLSRALEPRSRALHEIWVDGEKAALEDPGESHDTEPLYGASYLPRKLKTAVTVPGDNAVDLFTQDVGLLAVVEREAAPRIRGYGVFAGGGLGMTHRKPDTFARLASPLGVVPPERAIDVVLAILEIFRDHGDRTDRRHARLKYLVEAWGVDRFRREVEERLGSRFEAWKPSPPMDLPDGLGVHEQGDGRVFVGLHVPNGRIVDTPDRRLRTGLAEVVRALEPGVVLTPTQNVLLTDLEPGAEAEVAAILAAYRVPLAPPEPVRRFALACPALPTCGLALAEAERAFPAVLDGLAGVLSGLGLDDEPLSVRMTGCPNGCARPYAADVGIVGRKPDVYDVYLGGGLAGDRLAFLWREQVPVGELATELEPLFAAWAAHRLGDEGFGSFVRRHLAVESPGRLLTGSKELPEPPSEASVTTHSVFGSGGGVPLGSPSVPPTTQHRGQEMP